MPSARAFHLTKISMESSSAVAASVAVASSGRSPPHELLCQVDVFGESAQHVNLRRGPLVSGPRHTA